MSEFRNLKPSARTYITAVVVLGAAILAYSVHRLYAEPLDQQWLILAGLTLLTGSFSVKVSSINAYISVSEIFVIASVLLFGTEAGAVTVLLECLVILLWMRPGQGRIYRLAFNIAAPAIAIWVSGRVFYEVSGTVPYSKLSGEVPGLPQLFFPLFVFTTLYFLLNSWLVAIAVGLEKGRSSRSLWWKNFAWLSINYFSGASVAALIVTYTRRIEVSTLVIIVPLLVISYLTFRTAMGRAEDSYAHVSQLNRLYLSTIETLAMAIDAKDQITHGHIRRVQEYAVGLARRIGVSDDNLVKAVEAAALLHDMGKLAVPEYILNKPGKLTPAEFEKMKLHASVGADILSAIEFPYPVVPIVRHHHENWDGTGYPDGLRGTDIPIGARILSVVDCFDALTSDRPYRPRLSDEAAIDILRSRRGNMYDPLVVDTFIRVHNEIAPHSPHSSLSDSVLQEITSSVQAVATQDVSNMNSNEDAEVTLQREVTFAALEAATKALQRVMPVTHATFFLYDVEVDALVQVWQFGWGDEERNGLRMELGERLSGWVGANKKPILNSDPKLDLGTSADRWSLKSALSVPITSDRELIGVFALYSPAQNPFGTSDSQIVIRLLEGIAPLLKRVELHRAA